MSETTPGARRLRVPDLAARDLRSAAGERTPPVEPVVGAAFVSVCASVLLGALIMSIILATGRVRPVPAYELFGSAFFGVSIAAFIVGALHLAVMDSRRQHSGDHDH